STVETLREETQPCISPYGVPLKISALEREQACEHRPQTIVASQGSRASRSESFAWVRIGRLDPVLTRPCSVFIRDAKRYDRHIPFNSGFASASAQTSRPRNARVNGFTGQRFDFWHEPKAVSRGPSAPVKTVGRLVPSAGNHGSELSLPVMRISV